MLGSFFSAADRVGSGAREARRMGRKRFMKDWKFGGYKNGQNLR
jgi:hypothetical protein